MKKIFSNTILMAMGLLALSSCDEDRDSNPVVTQPTKFVLNQPVVANGTVDLSKTTQFDLTWSQPTPYTDQNAPVIPTYTVQLSETGSFERAYDADAEDNLDADFIELDQTYSTGNATLMAEDVAKALQQLSRWEEDVVPQSLELCIRLKAAIQDAGMKEHKVVYSNVVKMKVKPYYIELKAASPDYWYLIGGDIADGSWGGEVPTNIVPMESIDGESYDAKTGFGKMQWIGYLAGNGFKLKHYADNWEYQWGQGDAFGSYKLNDGGSGNITVPSAGIYQVLLNTATDELTIEPYSGAVTVYSGMAVSGSFNGWSDTDMMPVHTYAGAENHDWYITITLAANDEIKVKQAGSWDFNAGLKKNGGILNTYERRGVDGKTIIETGLYVYGENNGDNIVIPEDGQYTILFNDITSFIRFIKK